MAGILEFRTSSGLSLRASVLRFSVFCSMRFDFHLRNLSLHVLFGLVFAVVLQIPSIKRTLQWHVCKSVWLSLKLTAETDGDFFSGAAEICCDVSRTAEIYSYHHL